VQTHVAFRVSLFLVIILVLSPVRKIKKLTWEFHHPHQRSSNFIAYHGSHSRIKQTWCDGHDSDAIASKVSSHRESERSDSSFGGTVRNFTQTSAKENSFFSRTGRFTLAWLTVESSCGSDHDDNSAFTVLPNGLGPRHVG
jgi:hypothetical protein